MKTTEKQQEPLSILKKENGEMAIISNYSYSEGDIIYKLIGSISSKRTRETIEVGDGVHLLDEFAQFINHSFKPSVRIVGSELIAIKKILISDEITFDYTKNESNIISPFICYETGITVDGGLCKL